MNVGVAVHRRAGGGAAGLLVLLASVAGVGAGCSTVTYRVPGLEVQRLATLPPQERGDGVRVVPEKAPLYPSTERPPAPPAPPPPPVVASPPSGYDPDVVVVEGEPPPAIVTTGPEVFVEVGGPVGGPRGHAGLPPRVVGSAAPVRGAPPPSRSAFTGKPVSSGSGWRGSPVTSAPRPTAPSRASFSPSSSTHSHSSGGGGGHHSSGGGSNAAGAVGAAVAVVGLVAIVAVAASSAAEADHARKFDGWVDVDSSHPLVLHYRGNQERIIPLNRLRPIDTIGLEYGVLSADDGPVQRQPPAR